jgi:hypothetical protein
VKLQVPFGETLSVELDQYCSHYGLQDSEIHPTHNEVISIRSRKQNQPTQSNLAKLRSIVWLKMMISSFSVKFPTLIKNPCPSLGSMFFGGFVVHLHVGCTMHNNEEYHSVFVGLSKFKFGNKTQCFFPSKTLGLGHKRGASMAHVLATS